MFVAKKKTPLAAVFLCPSAWGLKLPIQQMDRISNKNSYEKSYENCYENSKNILIMFEWHSKDFVCFSHLILERMDFTKRKPNTLLEICFEKNYPSCSFTFSCHCGWKGMSIWPTNNWKNEQTFLEHAFPKDFRSKIYGQI